MITVTTNLKHAPAVSAAPAVQAVPVQVSPVPLLNTRLMNISPRAMSLMSHHQALVPGICVKLWIRIAGRNMIMC